MHQLIIQGRPQLFIPNKQYHQHIDLRTTMSPAEADYHCRHWHSLKIMPRADFFILRVLLMAARAQPLNPEFNIHMMFNPQGHEPRGPKQEYPGWYGEWEKGLISSAYPAHRGMWNAPSK